MLYAFPFSPMYATYPAHLTLLDLITVIILANRTSYEAPHYAVFTSLLPLPPSQLKIFSSAPCSQTPPIFNTGNVRFPITVTSEPNRSKCKREKTLWVDRQHLLSVKVHQSANKSNNNPHLTPKRPLVLSTRSPLHFTLTPSHIQLFSPIHRE
jgi:hypothetical protein